MKAAFSNTVQTHSSAATSEGGSTFKMYRLRRKQDTTDTLIQTQVSV